ncbi:7-carboxy-7-deazaguanine synthase [Natranaerovirga hydrolytica]|uniref:7-carboxy-7-deazaguanine synthase n=1 Tax=Natranaerovirga hydrolytica TaxID=680378 RepID=A0A4V2Q088_9FIRM|nr:putative 7-carboxy-7-deazaguanine synthase QueE [Natranaerovirga hydrolytica]TCK92821.1 7-carboxy-7-deazaguanine synthase [Natranaerovirga hydrolytica]
MSYKVVEKFISINGEGQRAGQLAVFIRFAGCNLNCSYCDTLWANEKNVDYEVMTLEDIYTYIESTGVKNITITGGEPLLQDNIFDLIKVLTAENELRLEIETNGSVSIKKYYEKLNHPPSFTMDYKLESSQMEDKMNIDNFNVLTQKDTVKFVVGDMKDLIKVKEVIDEYNLTEKTNVYLSPIYGKINYQDMVDFMIENKLNDVSLQLQLHKIIWDPNQKGV